MTDDTKINKILNSNHWPLTILGSLSSLANLFLPFILVRILSADSLGAYKIFFLYINFFPTMSLTSGFSSNLSYWVQLKDEVFSRVALTWYYIHSFIFALVVLILVILLPNLSPENPNLHYWLPVVGLATLLSMTYEQFKLANDQFFKSGIFLIIFDVIRTVSIISVASLTKNVEYVVISYGLVMLIKSCLGFYKLHGLLDFKNLFKKLEIFKQVVNLSLPTSLAGALSSVSLYIDQILMSFFLTTSQFATFSLGCLALPPLHIFENSLNRALNINLLKTVKFENPFLIQQRLIRESMINLGRVLIPSVIFLIYFSREIVVVLFSENYIESSNVLKLYALSYLILIIPFDSIYKFKGNNKIILNSYFWGAVSSSILVILGVAFWGWIGALAGSLIARTIQRVMLFKKSINEISSNITSIIPFFDWFKVFVLQCVFIAIYELINFYFELEQNSDILKLLISVSVFVIFNGLIVFWRWALNVTSLNQHVMHVSTSFKTGGLEKFILNLAISRTSKFGPSSTFIYAYDNQNIQEAKDDFVKRAQEHHIPVMDKKKNDGFSLMTIIQILRFMYKNQIYVLHTHDLGPLIYSSIIKLFTMNSVRIVHTQHSSNYLTKNSKYNFYEKFFLIFVDHFVVVSDQLKNEYQLQNRYKGKIEVIENGIPIDNDPHFNRLDCKKSISEKFQNTNGMLPTHTRWIICMARIAPGKGQDHLVKQWSSLSDYIKTFYTLIIIGPVQNKSYFDKVLNNDFKNDLGRSIFIFSETNQPESWYMASDYYISASESEGLPLSPIEAYMYNNKLLLSPIRGHLAFSQFCVYFNTGIKSDQEYDSKKNPIYDLEAILNQERLESEGKSTSLFKNLNLRQDFINRWNISTTLSNYERLYFK